MPKCPYCGKSIDALITDAEELRIYRMYFINNHVEWECIDSETIDSSEVYTCPECGETICHNYNDAVAFLKGEVNL